MNGADGFDLVGLSSREVTVKFDACIALTAAVASASLTGLKVAPWHFLTSKRIGSPLSELRSANTSQYSSGINARISRSRSITKRAATD